MDLATIIGIIAGIVAIVLGTTNTLQTPAGLGYFIDPPSFVIVIGGTIGATLITFPLDTFKTFGAVARNAFFVQKFSNDETIRTMTELSQIARVEGILALEDRLDALEDDFMRRALVAAVDGADPDELRAKLETEVGYIEARHTAGQDIFKYMNTYAPAWGMIGTLCGLVLMLQALDDPSSIGPKMAIALITTFYGAVLANLVFGPIAAKLKINSQAEMLYRQITIEGVIMIVAGEQSRKVEETLTSFLAPSIREQILLQSGGG